MGQPTICSGPMKWVSRTVSFLAAALSALLAFSLCPQSKGQGDSSGRWKERFLSEAPQKWEAYRSFAKGLQGTITHKTYHGKEASGSPHTMRYEGRQRGQWARSVSQEIIPRVGKDSFPDEVKAVNSRYAFVLRKKTPTSDWALVALDTDLRDDSPINPREQESLVLNASCVLFSIQGRMLSEIAQESGFVLKTAKGTPQDGRELVRIDFSHQYTPHADKRRSSINAQMWQSIEGWVLLDPEAFWAIHECQVKTFNLGAVEGTISQKNEYRRAEGDFPVLTRIVQQARYADPIYPAREETKVSTYDWYVDKTVDESEFTLTAFGLPEPLGVTWSKPTPWYLWLGLAGGLCLALGGVFRWLKRRAAPTAQ